MTATLVTPGIARTLSITAGQNARMRGRVRIAGRRQRQLRGEDVVRGEPGVHAHAARAKLLIRRPAPTSRITARAISATTSTARTLLVRRLADVRGAVVFQQRQTVSPRSTDSVGTTPKTSAGDERQRRR